MTRVTVHDFVRKVTLYVPAEQETGYVITWPQSRDNMATVTNERKVLSVEEKKKLIRQIENVRKES